MHARPGTGKQSRPLLPRAGTIRRHAKTAVAAGIAWANKRAHGCMPPPTNRATYRARHHRMRVGRQRTGVNFDGRNPNRDRPTIGRPAPDRRSVPTRHDVPPWDPPHGGNTRPDGSRPAEAVPDVPAHAKPSPGRLTGIVRHSSIVALQYKVGRPTGTPQSKRDKGRKVPGFQRASKKLRQALFQWNQAIPAQPRKTKRAATGTTRNARPPKNATAANASPVAKSRYQARWASRRLPGLFADDNRVIRPSVPRSRNAWPGRVPNLPTRPATA